ncbi:hypothetical protein C667_00260 [Thauera phenylacetica B4P]|uniref:Membrane associated hydrolase n=1 Tax=Thauera phenylacetica B4P TaxID=1234382 RepID=N6YXP2_9RHOO|nr:hypothetical protein C667_00260 [Thauera phenylacetica B4P]
MRLGHDDRNLYVRFKAYDDEPGSIVAQQMRRDVEAMLAEDVLAIAIDPEGDARNGYLFVVNPNGAQFDALIFDGGQIRFDWDAQWISNARIEADGWQAELSIPLAALASQPAGESRRHWRINAERWMPRGSERVRLAGVQPDKDVHSLGDALRIPAIEAESTAQNLRLKPALRWVGESAAASGTGRDRQRLEPSLEVFHQAQSGLRSALALNIDFAEAEADERQVNLTRFELFRPEKREFFLRDAGRFTFGGLIESTVIPYYSRRVGLDANGRGRSLDAGLKVSGQLGGWDVGAFASRVAGGPTEPGSPNQRAAEVAVVRLARPQGEHGRLGLLATTGNPAGTSSSSLVGLDYQHRDTQWQGDKTLEAHAWAMHSRNEGQGDDSAWGGSILLPNVGLNLRAEVQRIGTNFNPALGYLAESGIVRSIGESAWWHRTVEGADIMPGLDWQYRRKLDGSETSWQLNPEIAYFTPAGEGGLVEWFVEADTLASGYAPVPKLWIPPGSYRWHYLFGTLQSATSRPMYFTAEWRFGGYYDGKRNDQSARIDWKPTPSWGAQLGLARNELVLPDASFTAWTSSFRIDYTPSTRLGQSLLVQWDNVTHQLGFSARLRWQWSPGKEAIVALDRLGYTGERNAGQIGQTVGMLKLVWNFEP